jgi:hypothetical protein
MHPAEPPHQAHDTEAAVWILIAILLGLTCFAFLCLLHKV